MEQKDTGKKFSESLFKSQKLHQILFEKASDAIFFTEESKIIDCNESAMLMFGATSKEEIIGRFPFDFSPELQPDGNSSTENATKLISEAERESTRKFTWEYLKIDGTSFDTEVTLNSFGHDNHTFLQFSLHDITFLKKYKKEQPKTEIKYKKIFDNIQDIIYRSDLNGRIVEISPSVENYSNYTSSEIIGQPIEDFYYNPGDRKNFMLEIEKKGEVLDFEILLRRKDNEPVWASLNAHFFYDENGQVAGTEGAVRDLTERKQAEEKFKLSLSLLQATLDSTADSILVIDRSGRISSYNKQFKILFGLSDELLESGDDAAAIQSVLNLLKSPEQFVSKIQFLYDNPELDSFDTIEFKDGRVIERFSCPQRFDGMPIGRVWSFRDVTVRKYAEDQLNLIGHAMKSINECISITDCKDRILFVNEAFLNTYGYNESELLGKNVAMLRSPNNDPEIVKKILDLTSDSGWNGEILNQRKDGTDFLISLSTTMIKNEKGEILGLVGVAVDITDRKKVENKLKESEERYRSFFEGSPDAIFLADAETGIIIDANPASAALLKKPLNEIIGMHQTMLHPKKEEHFSRKIFQTDVEKTQQTNQSKSNEILIICSDGTEIPVEIMANMVHINGRPVLQGVFRNITERKQAEKDIQESEKRFRLLIENQGEGISIVDPDENFILANPAAEVIFGVQPGKLINRNLREFTDIDQFKQILQESEKRSKNVKSTYELDIITPGVIRKNLLVTATPQTNDEGKYIGTFGVISDITDRKKAEELLRQSEMKYRNLIETMPDAVYRSTPEGKFVEVNPALVKILGYESKEELMAIDIKTQLYFDPVDRERMALIMKNEELGVFPLRKKDGSAVWLEDHGWYITDENGKIIFHEGIMRDVTDRKMTEMQLQKFSEELQELNATKDKFFSIIAHDLKSPFNSISGLSEIIKHEAKHLDIAMIEQYAGIIHSSSDNTYRLLENLLDWARMQQGNMPFVRKPLILGELTSDVFELFSESVWKKNIKLINSVHGNIIIYADSNMIKTVIRNLVSNAIKFTSSEGTIEVSAIADGNTVRISVRDSGTGIKQEDLGKLFRIGSNYTRPGTENESGTGLGLILCKDFIEKHQGTIWVESEVGKGSSFIFTINNQRELLNK